MGAVVCPDEARPSAEVHVRNSFVLKGCGGHWLISRVALPGGNLGRRVFAVNFTEVKGIRNGRITFNEDVWGTQARQYGGHGVNTRHPRPFRQCRAICALRRYPVKFDTRLSMIRILPFLRLVRSLPPEFACSLDLIDYPCRFPGPTFTHPPW